MNNEKIALSPAEVSQTLGISLNSVYTYIREGKIPHFRLGKRILISRIELEKLTSRKSS
jgi:excisionase family DNA binding protein